MSHVRMSAVSGTPAVLAALCTTLNCAAASETPWDGFTTPSKNISCMYSHDPSPSLRCDIRERSATQSRPADCDLDWGDAFEIGQSSNNGTMVCHGDTTFADGLPVLRYGAVWSRQGITCRSETSGLTCVNCKGHGFHVSRASQHTF